MANFLQKLKIGSLERKLKKAERKSFYQEEAASIGPAVRAARFFQEGKYWQCVCQAYDVILRFHDYCSAYYYLGMSLVHLGEVTLGLHYLRETIRSGMKTMDSIDPKYVDDYLHASQDHGRLAEARTFFEQLAEKDARARNLLKSLQYQGKL